MHDTDAESPRDRGTARLRVGLVPPPRMADQFEIGRNVYAPFVVLWSSIGRGTTTFTYTYPRNSVSRRETLKKPSLSPRLDIRDTCQLETQKSKQMSIASLAAVSHSCSCNQWGRPTSLAPCRLGLIRTLCPLYSHRSRHPNRPQHLQSFFCPHGLLPCTYVSYKRLVLLGKELVVASTEHWPDGQTSPADKQNSNRLLFFLSNTSYPCSHYSRHIRALGVVVRAGTT